MQFVPDTIKSDGLLMLVAIIWGFAFVAQRSGMEVIGPFAFNGARLALGTLSLVPFLLLQKRREARKSRVDDPGRLSPRSRMLWAVTAGTVLFLAVSLQQIGLVSTTAATQASSPASMSSWYLCWDSSWGEPRESGSGSAPCWP